MIIERVLISFLKGEKCLFLIDVALESVCVTTVGKMKTNLTATTKKNVV